MNGSEQNSDSRTENVLLTRIGEDAVLRPLENVSMNDVKDYVALERKRSRRALVWTSTLMLCVFLFFTIVFLSLGLFMMRENRALSSAVLELQKVTAANAQFASSFSNGISSVFLALDNVDDRVDMIEKSKTTLYQEYDALLVDVQRIKSAIGGTDEKIDSRMNRLTEELAGAEKALRNDVDALREEVASVLMSIPVGAARPAEDTVAVADTGERADAPPPGTASPTGQVSAVALGPENADASGVGAGSTTNAPDVIDIQSLQPPPGEREIQVIAYPNGDRYEGEMLNGLMHGWGVYYHQNGDRYEGQFEYDLKHGSGVMVYNSGDRYEGGFASDGRSGKGRFYMKSGDKYVGEFENDAMHGNGVFIQKNGNRYSGGFSNGERHGNGTLEFANGDRYAGTFDHGMRSGRGTYVFSDGGRYVGEFRDGLRHGNGKYFYPGGDIYEGQFNTGKREGEGVFVQANGKAHQGVMEKWGALAAPCKLGGSLISIHKFIDDSIALDHNTANMRVNPRAIRTTHLGRKQRREVRMKENSIKVFALAVCASLVIPGSAMAAITLPFADGFESFSATGNYSTNGGGIVESQSAVVLTAAGSSSLIVSNDTVSLAITDGQYSNAWIQVYARPVVGSADPSVSGVSGAFYVRNDGVVRVYGSGGWASASGSVTPGNWVGFILHADHKNDKYDLYTSTGPFLSTATLVANEIAMSGSIDDLEEFSVQSGDAGYIDGLGVSAGGEDVSAASPNRVAVASFGSNTDLREFRLPVYSGTWTNPATGRALAGALGAALLSGLVQDDEVHIAGESAWFWDEYVVDFNGQFIIGAGTPGAPAVGATRVFENTRLLIDLDDARPDTYAFFPYDTATITAVNGKSTANVSGDIVTFTLLGTGNNPGGFTGLEWNDTTAFSDLPFGPGVISGDRLFVALPGDLNRYTEYWWNGSEWRLFASQATGNVPEGSRCWVRRPNTGGTADVQYTRP